MLIANRHSAFDLNAYVLNFIQTCYIKIQQQLFQTFPYFSFMHIIKKYVHDKSRFLKPIIIQAFAAANDRRKKTLSFKWVLVIIWKYIKMIKLANIYRNMKSKTLIKIIYFIPGFFILKISQHCRKLYNFHVKVTLRYITKKYHVKIFNCLKCWIVKIFYCFI